MRSDDTACEGECIVANKDKPNNVSIYDIGLKMGLMLFLY